MDARRLPARHAQRWRGHDYSDCGAYFVTICTQDRICRFGSIRDGVLDHNDVGRAACEAWASLGARFPGVHPGTYVVMPNHVHGILTLSSQAAVVPAPPRSAVPDARTDSAGIVRLSDVVGAFKSIVAVQWRRLETLRARVSPPGRLWQRNFWDRVLRDEEEVSRAAAYIEGNVANWATDPIRSGLTP